MLRLLKVATPLTALTVLVPASVPLEGLVPIATVIEALELVTVLPPASCTATLTAGLIESAAVALLGCIVKASLRVILKVKLVAWVKGELVALRVYPLPALSILRLLKVAIPLAALIVLVPDNVPLDGLVLIATVIDALEVVTVLPLASWTATVTAGLIDAAAKVLLGCCTKANLLAAPAVILKAELVAPLRPVLEALRV